MYHAITEVAEMLGLPSHVLRFWETKMHQIQPMKRSGGRRFYREEDILILRYIQHLLHHQGYTIRGAQKFLKTMTKAQILARARDLFSGETSDVVVPVVSETPEKKEMTEKAIALLTLAKEKLETLQKQMSDAGHAVVSDS
jgi:DNA-binding transcriptional MerR regulator